MSYARYTRYCSEDLATVSMSAPHAVVFTLNRTALLCMKLATLESWVIQHALQYSVIMTYCIAGYFRGIHISRIGSISRKQIS